MVTATSSCSQASTARQRSSRVPSAASSRRPRRYSPPGSSACSGRGRGVVTARPLSTWAFAKAASVGHAGSLGCAGAGGDRRRKLVPVVWQEGAAACWQEDDGREDDDLELARYRLDTHRAAGRAQRFAAHDRCRRRRERAVRLARQQYEDAAAGDQPSSASDGSEDSEHPPASPLAGPRSSSNSFAGAVDEALCLTSSRPDVPTVQEAGPPEDYLTRRRSHVLHNLKFKHCKEDRLHAIKRLGHKVQSEFKIAKLKTARCREFEAMPLVDREALRKAFLEAAEGAEALDLRGLRAAVKGFGLTPKSEAEKRELNTVCTEAVAISDIDFFTFSFDVIPRGRKVLRQSRKGMLLKYFQIYDLNDSGSLSCEECRLLFMHWCAFELDSVSFASMKSVFDEELAKITSSGKAGGEVRFDEFENVMSRLQEQVERAIQVRVGEIESKELLTADDLKAHGHELVPLFAAYQRADTDGTGLTSRQLMCVLAEMGLRPSEVEAGADLDHILNAISGELDVGLAFHDFLRAVRAARKLILLSGHRTLKERFDRLDKAKARVLPKGGVSVLLELMGLVPRCREDQAAILRLLTEFGVDSCCALTFLQFEEVALKVRERLKAAQHDRVRRSAAKEFGIPLRELAVFRDMFYNCNVDSCGRITADQVKPLLDSLDMNVLPEDVDAAMNRYGFTVAAGEGFCSEGTLRAVGSVQVIDFEGFLRLMMNTVRGRKEP